MSLILAIESGTEICSVAIVKDGGEVLALRESSVGRDHARLIAAFADELLCEVGIVASQLTAVAVSKGPGSYTGLRVGVSFAKGMCYALGIPLIGVASLEALCCAARMKEEFESGAVLLPMIDARRMEVYTQPFDGEGREMADVESVIIDEGSFERWRTSAKEVVMFGDGAAKCCEVLPWVKFVDVAPSAVAVAKVAAQREARGESEDVAYFEPFYLKEAVVTKSKKRYF
ncbi:MAG: tRNA (adenosine(37)-N6)-threonylcarbamoyltransferase complex dimerization subunit type 1 TsaB [Rikenellaceae bacterium]